VSWAAGGVAQARGVDAESAEACTIGGRGAHTDALGDGANGVVWADDKQIVDLRIRRRYAAVPMLAIDVMDLSA